MLWHSGWIRLCSRNNDKFEYFIDYFRKQFIGEKVAQRHRRHEIKIDFNHHTSVKKDGLKTTSSLESWHKKFASLVGSPKSFLYKFIDALKEEQDYNEKRYDELLLQRSLTKKN